MSMVKRHSKTTSRRRSIGSRSSTSTISQKLQKVKDGDYEWIKRGLISEHFAEFHRGIDLTKLLKHVPVKKHKPLLK